MKKLLNFGKVLTKEEMKNLAGGLSESAVSYDCVFTFSDGYSYHKLYVGATGGQVQCAADQDAMALGSGCTGADCIGSGAAAC